jgi:hypothetical protein
MIRLLKEMFWSNRLTITSKELKEAIARNPNEYSKK